jgi:hypothetical protein
MMTNIRGLVAGNLKDLVSAGKRYCFQEKTPSSVCSPKSRGNRSSTNFFLLHLSEAIWNKTHDIPAAS